MSKLIKMGYNSGFSWINFFVGILAATAINTLTTYFSSEESSAFLLLSAILILSSSGFLFSIYALLCITKTEMDFEINCNRPIRTAQELCIRQKEVWEAKYEKSKGKIKLNIFITVILLLLGITALML